MVDMVRSQLAGTESIPAPSRNHRKESIVSPQTPAEMCRQAIHADGNKRFTEAHRIGENGNTAA
jgi:hypothetical protein